MRFTRWELSALAEGFELSVEGASDEDSGGSESGTISSDRGEVKDMSE